MFECVQGPGIAPVGQRCDGFGIQSGLPGARMRESDAHCRSVLFQATAVTAAAGPAPRINDEVPQFHGDAMLTGIRPAMDDQSPTHPRAKPHEQLRARMRVIHQIFTIGRSQGVVFQDHG